MKPVNCYFLLLCLLFSCNSNDFGSNGQQLNSYGEEPKSAEELKAELKEQENNAPLSYLEDRDVTLKPNLVQTRRAGLFHDAEYEIDGATITGQFINSATLAKYKDIEVKISFYSQTETLIDEQNYVVYKYSEPHSTEPFTIRIDNLPRAYKNFGFEIIGATAVE